jgi:ribosomal protein L7/L12
LKDSKEIVDRVPSFIKEGVTEQEAMSAKRALEAVGVGVEIFVDKTSWDVYLKSTTSCKTALLPGLAKLQVTKAIRDTMGLMTLSEALQTVNNAPCYVACNKSKSVATQIVKALVDAGAEVELR